MTLAIGGVYAGGAGGLAREILDIEDGRVFYRDYTLTDGQPLTARGNCARATFRNWMTRACTPEEIARLRREETPTFDRILFESLSVLLP
jgi:hypothetical protein